MQKYYVVCDGSRSMGVVATNMKNFFTGANLLDQAESIFSGGLTNELEVRCTLEAITLFKKNGKPDHILFIDQAVKLKPRATHSEPPVNLLKQSA